MILATTTSHPTSHVLTIAIITGVVLLVVLVGLFCLKVLFQIIAAEEEIRREHHADQLAAEAANQRAAGRHQLKPHHKEAK